MTQDHVLNRQKKIPMFWMWDFPFFGLQSLPSSVKESLPFNSRSKSCKSAKFCIKVGFQVQVKKNYFEVDGVIAKVFEKMTY